MAVHREPLEAAPQPNAGTSLQVAVRSSAEGKGIYGGVAEASSASILLGTLQSAAGLSSDVQELLVSLLCRVPWWNFIWPMAISSIC